MSNRRPRTPDENCAVEQMRCVTFPSASWDKRFYRSIYSVETISEKEAAQLWRIFIKYRRQINFPAKERFMEMAEKLAAPDFRKVEAMRREQAEIDRLKREASQGNA